jgi:hypothetical protein
VGIPTVAVVENMSELKLPGLAAELETLIERHELSTAAADDLRQLVGTPQAVFGSSHVTRLKEMWGIDASFSVPLLGELAASADAGVPHVLSQPDSEASSLYGQIAEAVDAEVSSLASLTLPGVRYTEADNLVAITLPDGTAQSISPLELRRRCRSPSNTPDSLPADVAPVDIVPMGNYAISVRWNDGHQSLLPYAAFIDEYSSSLAR